MSATQPAFGLSATFLAGTAYGSATLQNTTISGATAGGGKHTYGGGMLFDFSIFSTLKVETGMLYFPKTFTWTDTSEASTIQFNSLQFPLLLKFYFMPALSFGLGAYFSHGVGLKPAYKNVYSADETGAVASLELKARVVSRVYFVAMARYLMGISNTSQLPGNTLFLRDFQGLIGLSLGRR